MNRGWKTGLRLAGLAAVASLCLVAWRSGVLRNFCWSALVAHRAQWEAYVAGHEFTAALMFVGVYALTVAIYLPVGAWLSLLGGLLFGMWLGGVLTVIAAASGAVAAFLLARGLLAPFCEAQFGRQIARLRPGLERDGFSYLLALRLIPLFPFWLVNLAPALIGIRLAPYAVATLLGVIPTSFVLNAVGAGLGATLAAGGQPSAVMLMRPSIVLPLVLLAVLALLPALWRQWRSRRRVARRA